MFTLIKNEKISLLTDNAVIPKAEMPQMETLFDAGSQLNETLLGAEAQLRASIRKGYEKGFVTGRKRGHEQSRKDVNQFMTKLATDASIQQKKLEENVALLAMQVVRKIAENLGSADTVAALAETAARQLVGSSRMTVYVHHTALPEVEKRFAEKIRTGASLDIRCDDTVGVFDCLIETQFGTTVASLDAQLDSLQKALS